MSECADDKYIRVTDRINRLKWKVSKSKVERNFKPEYTSDYVTERLDNLRQATKYITGKDDCRILEIGAYEGLGSNWFLDEVLTGNNCDLVAVDNTPKRLLYHNTAFKRWAGKMRICVGTSFDVLGKLYSSMEEYDFIYIDGSHFGIHVIEDAVLSWRLLKPGGVMLFDDYGWEDKAYFKKEFNADYDAIVDKYDLDGRCPLTPRAAIDSFLKTYYAEYKLLFSNYQVAVQKGPSLIQDELGQPVCYRYLRHV